METVGIVNPHTGDVHDVPFDQIQHFLDDGGEFADETEKAKAIQLKKFASGESEIAPTPFNNPSGLLKEGNIDLNNRPMVNNPETGGKSTVFSTSFGTPEGEVLVPRVSDEGKILSEQEAQDQFHKTGKHLGIFRNPESATKFAEQLHKDQEKQYMPPEQKGFKGLAQDTAQMLRGALKGGMGFLKSLPEEIPATANLIKENPGRALGEASAGIAETGKSILNTPHDILTELGKKDIIPNWLKKYNELPLTHIPEDTGVEKAMGLDKPVKGGRLLRDIPELVAAGKSIPHLASIGASAVKTGANLAKAGASKFKAPDLSKAIKKTQATVNQATKNTGKVFNQVEKAVDKAGVNKVYIPKNVIEQAESFLSKSLANKKLIEEAKTGDFKALRKLQGDLRKKGEKGLSSDSLAENDLGEEILDTRENINSYISKHLDKSGLEQEARDLRRARKDYRDIKDTYFSTPALARVFGKSQKVPAKPKTLLKEDSVEMNRFMAAHPEVKKALSKALSHEKKMKAIKILGGIVGIGTAEEMVHRALK